MPHAPASGAAVANKSGCTCAAARRRARPMPGADLVMVGFRAGPRLVDPSKIRIRFGRNVMAHFLTIVAASSWVGGFSGKSRLSSRRNARVGLSVRVRDAAILDATASVWSQRAVQSSHVVSIQTRHKGGGVSVWPEGMPTGEGVGGGRPEELMAEACDEFPTAASEAPHSMSRCIGGPGVRDGCRDVSDT